MKYLKVFEDYKEDIDYRFSIEREDEYIYIKLFNSYNNKIGEVILKECYDSYETVESSSLSEEEFYNIFPNGDFMCLNHLEVVEYYRNLKYGKLLVEKAIEYTKTTSFKKMYLNASPLVYKNALRIDSLVKFYEKIGFIVFIDDYHNNKEMYLDLNIT